ERPETSGPVRQRGERGFGEERVGSQGRCASWLPRAAAPAREPGVMRTEDLIADLASRAAPVRPLPSPGIRVLAWSGVAMICAVVGTIVFGTRADLGAQMREPAFVLVGLVAFATSALAALASLVLAIPGAERSPALRSSTVAVVVLWAVILVAAIVRAGHGLAGAADWPICFVRVVAIALVPAGVLFGMLR